jgi:membrane-associated phospholipid phosphatase
VKAKEIPAMSYLRSRFGFLKYLSLHIIIGFLLSLICLRLFAHFAEELLENETLTDTLLASSFHANATPLATNFFLIITHFGLELLWLIVILLGLYFVYKRLRLYLLMLVVTIGGSELLNQSLKLFFSRPRPTFDDPIITALNYSFPSGHAMTSLVAYGLFAYLLASSTPNKARKLLITISAILLIALIGLSRIYLGVHYLSDVIAGFAAGGAWLAICITAFHEIHRRYPGKQPAVPSDSPPPMPDKLTVS